MVHARLCKGGLLMVLQCFSSADATLAGSDCRSNLKARIQVHESFTNLHPKPLEAKTTPATVRLPIW